MSQQGLRDFYETAVRDESLKAKLSAIGDKYGKRELDDPQREEVLREEILPLAKSYGFDFSLDDVKVQMQAGLSGRAGKLTDEELDAVVGGEACTCVVGGAGSSEGDSQGCGCVVMGFGVYRSTGRERCTCFFWGQGQP